MISLFQSSIPTCLYDLGPKIPNLTPNHVYFLKSLSTVCLIPSSQTRASWWFNITCYLRSDKLPGLTQLLPIQALATPMVFCCMRTWFLLLEIFWTNALSACHDLLLARHNGITMTWDLLHFYKGTFWCSDLVKECRVISQTLVFTTSSLEQACFLPMQGTPLASASAYVFIREMVRLHSIPDNIVYFNPSMASLRERMQLRERWFRLAGQLQRASYKKLSFLREINHKLPSVR